MLRDGGLEQRREFPVFALLAAYLILLSAIQVAVLATSLASLRLSRPLSFGILTLAVAAACLVWRRLTNAPAAARGKWLATRGWTGAIAGAFIALYLFLLACAVVVADVSWDGNTYHLPAIQVWFQEGKVVWVEGPDSGILSFINGYPKAAEVLALFLCTLVHPALANTFNLFYLPLGILGIASIAETLGASRRAALIAGAALLLVPINLGQSPTTYVDSAFGSAVIGWLAVTVRLLHPSPSHLTFQGLLLGCALGQMIGVKGTGVPLGALGTLALAAAHFGGRSRSFPARVLVAWWLGVGVCAFAVGGFWYARNLAHGHGPLYPIRLSIAGFILYPGLDPYSPAGAFATDGFIEHWPTPAQVAFTWLQGFWHWPRSIIGFDSRLGGLGFLWPLGCLPAVVALVRQRIRVRATWRDELMNQPLWLVLAIVSAGIILLPCPWWSRFTIWVYGLGLPCLAAVQRSSSGRWGRRWLVACAAIAVLEAGIVITRWQVPLLQFAIRDARGDPDAKPSGRIASHFYPPWQVRGSFLEHLTRTHDTIGIVPLPWYAEPVAGLLSQPIGARRIYFVPQDLEADFAAWYARVRPRYLVMEKRSDLPAPLAALHPQVHQTRSLTVLQFW